MNNLDNTIKIKITRIPGGFVASNSPENIGGGNTVAEALGHLMLTCPTEFGVASIEYTTDNSATRLYVIERGLNQRIV